MGGEVAKPWTGVRAENWSLASQATVISDLAQFVPVEAQGDRLRQGVWRVFGYQAGGITGRMIWAGEDNTVPSVRVPMPTRGWFAIFVGLFCIVPGGKTQVWLKLEGDRAPTARSAKAADGYWNVREVFYRVADLNGQHLELSQQLHGLRHRCGVAYIKLVPMSDVEVSAYQADRKHIGRPLAASCDGFSFIYERGPTTEEELLAEIEIYRDTDFKTLLLHLGGADQVNYPSKIAPMLGQGIDSFPEPGDRVFAESVQELARKGINPTKTLIDGAHTLGMAVHIGFRPALWSYYPPYADFFESPFYREHPEWRVIDRDGTAASRLSWAEPKVREHLLDVLREAMGFGADGVHVVFNRGFPMVLWEDAFCKMFEVKYGVDAKLLDESDARIQTMRVEIVTMFMRELRQMLDDESKRRGTTDRLAISVCVLANEADNLRYAVDLRRLAAERLIDDIHAYQYGFGQTTTQWDWPFFRTLSQATGVEVYAMMNFFEPVDEHVRELQDVYVQGASGISVWDAFTDDISALSAMQRFGRSDEFELQLKYARQTPASIPVHRLGNEIMDGRFPIFWGG